MVKSVSLTAKSIAKRASDVMTQTKLREKQTGMADDFPKTLSKRAGIPKTRF